MISIQVCPFVSERESRKKGISKEKSPPAYPGPDANKGDVCASCVYMHPPLPSQKGEVYTCFWQDVFPIKLESIPNWVSKVAKDHPCRTISLPSPRPPTTIYQCMKYLLQFSQLVHVAQCYILWSAERSFPSCYLRTINRRSQRWNLVLSAFKMFSSMELRLLPSLM